MDQKIQYYLDKMGFDIGETIDGDFGRKSYTALYMVQGYLNQNPNFLNNAEQNKITGARNQTTLDAVKAAANKGLTYWTVKNYNGAKPAPLKSGYNGHLDTSLNVPLTKTPGQTTSEIYTAVAWARLVDAAPENMRSTFSPTGDVSGYRPYKDQVRFYAGYYLEKVHDPIYTHGWNSADAATPTFDSGLSSAQTYIWNNRTSFGSNQYYFDSVSGAPGTGKALSGSGTSNHGWGVALDLPVKDPGSECYLLFTKDITYKGVTYKKDQKVYAKDNLSLFWELYNSYNGDGVTRKNNGKGYALTDRVKWLESNAESYGFKPLLISDEPVYNPIDKKYVNNYKETWHWNYKP